mmetsp:Transcript_8774/g.32856  ORF Transcript_8774/g.32856 Transcript_8774/m.32856 type:complete len:109 (+) Transcript_8774:2144-2470(+)
MYEMLYSMLICSFNAASHVAWKWGVRAKLLLRLSETGCWDLASTMASKGFRAPCLSAPTAARVTKDDMAARRGAVVFFPRRPPVTEARFPPTTELRAQELRAKDIVKV